MPCGGLVALLVGRGSSAPRMVFLRVEGILPKRRFCLYPTVVVIRPSFVDRVLLKLTGNSSFPISRACAITYALLEHPYRS